MPGQRRNIPLLPEVSLVIHAVKETRGLTPTASPGEIEVEDDHAEALAWLRLWLSRLEPVSNPPNPDSSGAVDMTASGSNIGLRQVAGVLPPVTK